jgi:hypothetical protein
MRGRGQGESYQGGGIGYDRLAARGGGQAQGCLESGQAQSPHAVLVWNAARVECERDVVRMSGDKLHSARGEILGRRYR